MVTTPTALLLHGAFTDASIWFRVIAHLQHHAIPVIAAANPLRGLAADASYISSVATQIDGPVVLVGHAYGGTVISAAGTAPNVVGLVYIAAYAPDEGESVRDLQRRFPTSSTLADHLEEISHPLCTGRPSTELTISTEAFQAVFADLPAALTQVMAVAQRPVAATACTESAPAAAWKTRPSWMLLAGADPAISPEAVRFCARRAEATLLAIGDAAHAVPLSHPTDVAELIRDAVRATT
ncbi:alpha/beta fold hydrolase [Streptomyces sp. Ru72]|uniref:alpha/beta fold hydrolase n=1 Tax=Streptomyces sp. Ru72 TaxID=2080747 RepID=UPI000CDDE42F|nr:alpha/beta hydrolase [Streptomyces sp. Ru72]POX50912.1 alpha/beta hydrolase [Streptomyces sp. Ru72]